MLAPAMRPVLLRMRAPFSGSICVRRNLFPADADKRMVDTVSRQHRFWKDIAMPAPTVVELLWGTGRPAKRGPKPSLSLEAIVGAAIELADAEGMAGVSMQRVAERLGYTKM